MAAIVLSLPSSEWVPLCLTLTETKAMRWFSEWQHCSQVWWPAWQKESTSSFKLSSALYTHTVCTHICTQVYIHTHAHACTHAHMHTPLKTKQNKWEQKSLYRQWQWEPWSRSCLNQKWFIWFPFSSWLASLLTRRLLLLFTTHRISRKAPWEILFRSATLCVSMHIKLRLLS